MERKREMEKGPTEKKGRVVWMHWFRITDLFQSDRHVLPSKFLALGPVSGPVSAPYKVGGYGK